MLPNQHNQHNQHNILPGESREEYNDRNGVYLSKWAWDCRKKFPLTAVPVNDLQPPTEPITPPKLLWVDVLAFDTSSPIGIADAFNLVTLPLTTGDEFQPLTPPTLPRR
jgi:hypothetical protein